MSHSEEEIARLVANLVLNILTNYFNDTAHVRSLEMTTIAPILTGVAAHIAKYADAVAVSGGGT